MKVLTNKQTKKHPPQRFLNQVIQNPCGGQQTR